MAAIPTTATTIGESARSAPRRSAVAGWVSYDVGNTIFSANIMSNYFALWVVRDAGGSDAMLAVAAAGASILMLAVAPALGALSDRSARRLPFLAVSTLACGALTAMLGAGGLGLALALFAAASFFFQAGLVFYDALLPVVSTPETRGRVGGLGVGLGYLGSLVGLAIGAATLRFGGDAPTIFRLTALAFLLFTLPCLLLVREPASGRRLDRAAVRSSFAEVTQTVALLRAQPRLARFLVGRVFYADAANTLTAYMGVYAVLEIGFSDARKDLLLLAGVGGALVGGLGWGRVVDRLGPESALRLVLGLWATVLAGAAAVGLGWLPREAFWLVAPLAGAALGSTWTTDRPLLIRLAPPEHLGQAMGLYAVTGRFAALLGMVAWAAIVGPLGWGRPVAVLTLLAMVAGAAVILRPLWQPTNAAHKGIP